MKVAVYGAGEIGHGIAYRLVTSPAVSELLWTNRTFKTIEHRVVDLQHGLSFAPTCHTVRACPVERLEANLAEVDVLILTSGAAVPAGGNRAALYRANQKHFREDLVPRLRGFGGIVLVVSNPVDLLARLLHVEGQLPAQRVFGLGTLVETARLKASLGSYLSPRRPAREVWAYVIGTHDEHCVVVPTTTGMGAALDPEILEIAKGEVIAGARRVKTGAPSSLHPISEAACFAVEAFASSRRSILTLSVKDPDNGLFYSLPCTVDRSGLVHRHAELLDGELIRKLGPALDSLRERIVAHPDIPMS